MDMQQPPLSGWWITGHQEHGVSRISPPCPKPSRILFLGDFATQFLGDDHPSALQALPPHRDCSVEMSPALSISWFNHPNIFFFFLDPRTCMSRCAGSLFPWGLSEGPDLVLVIANNGEKID